MPDTGVSIPLELLSEEAFAPFGRLIKFSQHPEDPRFEIVIREEIEPWRIAMFRVRQRTAERLECHPTSMESFEPVSGTGILLCAEPHAPEQVHAFLLDAPVCLYKAVWHEVITLSEEAIYKITENKEVNSQFHTFPFPVRFDITAPMK